LEVRGHPQNRCSTITLTTTTTADLYTETLTDLTRPLKVHRGQGPSTAHAGSLLRCECGEWLRAGRRGMPRLRAAACGICGARREELTGSRMA